MEFIIFYERSTVPPVEKIVGNARDVLALRFPQPSTKWQEDIIINSYTKRARRYSEYRRNANEIPSTGIALTQEQWHMIESLRMSWCQTPPSFREVHENEPFYAVGLDCGVTRTTFTAVSDRRRIIIPVDELPPELIQLIELVPSPTCDDPFCGWRE